MKRFKLFLIIFAFACLMSLTACKNNKIDAPTNVSIDEDNKLTWDGVSDAKSYVISFYYVDKETTFEDTTRKTNYSLDELEVGDYEISIKSVTGDKSKKDSVYTDAIQYHKYYETGCVYTLINNKTEYEITRVGKASGTFEIEDYYRGKAVTKIADAAFKGSSRIVGVTIGANISSLGDNAFYNCSKLESVVIPESVRSIGTSCFQSCRSLKEIVIPSSIDVIPSFCFAYCRSLTKAVIGENVITLSESCFQDCSALESIVIPNSVTSIELYAFSGCMNIETLTIGSGVTSIAENGFTRCSGLREVTFVDGSNLKTIGDQCFMDDTSLPTISLPEGLETLGNYCFYNCSSLTSISIPDTVSEVGSYAFNQTKIHTDAANNGDSFVYADNWLVYCFPTTLTTITEIDTTTLKDTIVGVANSVFKGATELKTLVLPASFKYIGDYAFQGCTSLWKFKTLDNSIVSIGDYAFLNCALTNISLGIGLEEIGNYAFYNNTQLDNNSLSPTTWIPETVTRIGTLAFKNTKLWNSPRDNDGIVYAANWVIGVNSSSSLGAVTLNFDTDLVAGIADYAFYNCDSLQSISGLSNCKYIGVGAFKGCTKLSSVSLNRNLTEIRDYTFSGCSSLIKVTMPRVLTTVGDYAFYQCTSLTSVELSSTKCTSIGKSAFYKDASITEVTLSKDLESIGDYAFYKCESLEAIELKDNVTYVGVKAFYKDIALKTVTLNEGLTSISESAFNSCTALTSITLPSTMETVYKSAFYKCESVTELNLNEGLTKISDYAFYGLSNVNTLDLPSSLREIGNYAFKGLTNVKVLYLSKDIKVIGQHAFYGCKNLTIYTDAESILGEWHSRFNSLYRPIFYSCEFNEDGSVYSITISKDLFQNKNASNGVNAPTCEGKTFVGWTDDESNTYSMEDLLTIEIEGKLIAKYE